MSKEINKILKEKRARSCPIVVWTTPDEFKRIREFKEKNNYTYHDLLKILFREVIKDERFNNLLPGTGSNDSTDNVSS